VSDVLPIGKLGLEHLASLVGPLTGDASVVLGPGVGRDVAVVDAGGPTYLLLKSDPITFATRHLGHYAVQVSANDIACAGGTPRWFLATLLLPEQATTPGLVADLFAQLRLACESSGIALVGGHTEVTVGLDRPVICGTMVGEVARDALVTPAGVRPGDAILLTKSIALEGTATIAGERRAELLAAGFAPEFLDRCERMLFDPGISVVPDARALCAAVPVHAMHDPTEGGLAKGLWELALASGMGVSFLSESVPVLPETRALCEHYALDPLGLLASGSLLAVVSSADRPVALTACEVAGIPCTQIATAHAGPALVRSVGRAGAEPLPRFDQDELTRLFA
jgi:hydrogenase maturation factor